MAATDNLYPITWDGIDPATILPTWNPFEGFAVRSVSASLDLSVVGITRADEHHPWTTGSYIGSFMQDSTGVPKTDNGKQSTTASANVVFPFRMAGRTIYKLDEAPPEPQGLLKDVMPDTSPYKRVAYWSAIETYLNRGGRVVGNWLPGDITNPTKWEPFSDPSQSSNLTWTLTRKPVFLGSGTYPSRVAPQDRELMKAYRLGFIGRGLGAKFLSANEKHILGPGEMFSSGYAFGDSMKHTELWKNGVSNSVISDQVTSSQTRCPWQKNLGSSSTFDPSGEYGRIILFPNSGWIEPYYAPVPGKGIYGDLSSGAYGINNSGYGGWAFDTGAWEDEGYVINGQGKYGCAANGLGNIPTEVPGIYFNLISLDLNFLTNRAYFLFPNDANLGMGPWADQLRVANNMLTKWTIGDTDGSYQFIGDKKHKIGVYSIIAETISEQPIYLARKSGTTYVDQPLYATSGGCGDLAQEEFTAKVNGIERDVLLEGKFISVSPSGNTIMLCGKQAKRTPKYIQQGTETDEVQVTDHYAGTGYGIYWQEAISIWKYGYKPGFSLPNDVGWTNAIFETQLLPSESQSSIPCSAQIVPSSSGSSSASTKIWTNKHIAGGPSWEVNVDADMGVYDYKPKQFESGTITDNGNWAISSKILGVTRGGADAIDLSGSNEFGIAQSTKKSLSQKFTNNAPNSPKAFSRDARKIAEDSPGNMLYGFGSNCIASACSNDGVTVFSRRPHPTMEDRCYSYRILSVSGQNMVIEGTPYMNTGFRVMIHKADVMPTGTQPMTMPGTTTGIYGTPVAYGYPSNIPSGFPPAPTPIPLLGGFASVPPDGALDFKTIPIGGLGLYTLGSWPGYRYSAPPAPGTPSWSALSGANGPKITKFGPAIYPHYPGPGWDEEQIVGLPQPLGWTYSDFYQLTWQQITQADPASLIETAPIDITPTASEFQIGSQWYTSLRPAIPYKFSFVSWDFINNRTTLRLEDFTFTSAGTNAYVVVGSDRYELGRTIEVINNGESFREADGGHLRETLNTDKYGAAQNSTNTGYGSRGAVNLLYASVVVNYDGVTQTLVPTSPTTLTNAKYGVFGCKVAITEDGQYVAVASPSEGYSENASQSPTAEGAVYLYRKLGSQYQQVSRITVPRFLPYESGTNGVEHIQFGSSVDFSGNNLLVGSRQGVYVYELGMSLNASIAPDVTLGSGNGTSLQGTLSETALTFIASASTSSRSSASLSGGRVDVIASVATRATLSASIEINSLPEFNSTVNMQATLTGNLVFGNKISISVKKIELGTSITSSMTEAPQALRSVLGLTSSINARASGAIGLVSRVSCSSSASGDIIRFVNINGQLDFNTRLSANNELFRINPFKIESSTYLASYLVGNLSYVKVELASVLQNTTSLSVSAAKLTSVGTTDSRQANIFEVGKTPSATIAGLGQRWTKRSDLQNNDLTTSVEWVEGKPPQLD